MPPSASGSILWSEKRLAAPWLPAPLLRRGREEAVGEILDQDRAVAVGEPLHVGGGRIGAPEIMDEQDEAAGRGGERRFQPAGVDAEAVVET